MEQQATIRWRGSQGGHYVDPTVEARCLYEIMRLRIEMMEKVNNLKETLRAELRAEIQLSNNELRAVIQQNKTDLQARILQSNNELRAQIRQSNTELREVTQHNKTDLQTPILQNKTDFQTQILRNNTEIRASRIMHRAPQIVTGPSNFTTNAALVIMVIAFIWNVFFACVCIVSILIINILA
ncbi:unnamed protein product [Meloidogyne enterolobii]|uniref:Uncharacterized protein n=1 Tax=Meloidogyne enterolobii TaxID=390850 RepID=A0ACB0YZT9_MELEN